MPQFLAPVAVTTTSSYVAIGTNPAGQGAIRLPNSQWIYARNGANSGDNPVMVLDSSNNLLINANGGSIYLGTADTATSLGSFSAALATMPGALALGGLSGATASSRYVGATTSGKPASGTFAKGDVVVDQTGKVWVNTTAGSPGTFTDVSSTSPYLSIAKWGVD